LGSTPDASSSILPEPTPAIDALIPHRLPMVFVDRLVAASENSATCTFTVSRRTACLRDGRLPAMYALESMAQAAAAHLGALALWRGEPPLGGYLVGVRDVALHVRALAPGDALIIDVHRTFGSDRLASYACCVRRGDVDVTTATLNVLRKPA
jgi:predicted hotdog family 3-hydroxylacyl-ACP dehydratase